MKQSAPPRLAPYRKGGGREGLPRRFSVDGICADGDERLGRLESRTSATTKAHMVAAVCIVVVVVTGGGGSLENEIVKEECVERGITHAR